MFFCFFYVYSFLKTHSKISEHVFSKFQLLMVNNPEGKLRREGKKEGGREGKKEGGKEGKERKKKGRKEKKITE